LDIGIQFGFVRELGVFMEMEVLTDLEVLVLVKRVEK
jgi:hypothetical protein